MPIDERDMRSHPDYHDGFFSAIDDDPLLDGSTPEFAAGWAAGEGHKRIYRDAGFSKDGATFIKSARGKTQ